MLLSNDEYKFKILNARTRFCRKVIQGPAFGADPIDKMEIINGGKDAGGFMVFATKNKVVGIVKLPLDGNPHGSMGLIAHPNEVKKTINFKNQYLTA